MKFIYNDAGRSTSKRPKQKYDCVVRATALALGDNYDRIYEWYARLGRKCDRGTEKKLWQDFLSNVGAWQLKLEKISFPPVAGQSRMNLDRFTREYPTGKYIVQMAGHLTTVIDGVVNDTFEPREFGCVYAVWKKIN